MRVPVLQLGIQLHEERADALLLHLSLRAVRPVVLSNLSVGWVGDDGRALPGGVLLTLPDRLQGHRVVPVRLPLVDIGDAFVRCMAWIRGRGKPVTATWRPRRQRSWRDDLAAILGEVEVDEDPDAFRAFLEDLGLEDAEEELAELFLPSGGDGS